TTLHLSFFQRSRRPRDLHSFPTRRSSDLKLPMADEAFSTFTDGEANRPGSFTRAASRSNASLVGSRSQIRFRHLSASACGVPLRSEEHTSELQSRGHLVCRLLLEKKNKVA